jgi:heterodisulfide reductase subunit C
LKPRSKRSSPGSPTRRSSRGARRSTARCCAAASASRCTCTPATATSTRICRSTPTITRCCSRRTPPSRGSWRSRARWAESSPASTGIGITKLEYLTAEELAPFARYKARVDPHGRFNAGKLLAGADLANAYTPSFSLIGHESLILEASEVGGIADSFKDCLRCGKCKPVCATHVPRANLLYSPRNKILAASLLIEAFLYEEQTRRGVSLRHFDEFSDVADHCTVCHKCAAPCPVDIDFGDVSIAMRNLLRREGRQPSRPRPQAAMFFLNATDATAIKLAKRAMIVWGFAAQRLAHRVGKRLGSCPGRRGVRRRRSAPRRFARKSFTSSTSRCPEGCRSKTARALLDIEDGAVVPIIRNPKLAGEDADAVFYFPGCGSERLFSQVGLATQAMLWHVGAQTVLPPGICAAAIRKPRPAITTADKRSSPTIACCSTASRTRSTISTFAR